jgi:hypothetical protein
MTIQFNCPKCDAVIGFDDKHAGKQAHCTSCGQHFIIPAKSFEKTKKIKLTEKKSAMPIPGFYRAVFVDSWKIFKFSSKNTFAILLFITAIVIVKFYVSEKNFTLTIAGQAMSIDIYIPLGWVLWAASWGLLFLYYCELAHSTAFDDDKLPILVLGGDFGTYSFLWKIFQPLYHILIILLVAFLPYILTIGIFYKTGIEQPVVLNVMLIYGLFVTPMAILNIAVGQDLTLVRPDYLIRQIAHAFMPYLVIVSLITCVGFIEQIAHQYNKDMSLNVAAGNLALNLIAQLLLLFAMRSIGLYARHYSCYFPW